MRVVMMQVVTRAMARRRQLRRRRRSLRGEEQLQGPLPAAEAPAASPSAAAAFEAAAALPQDPGSVASTSAAGMRTGPTRRQRASVLAAGARSVASAGAARWLAAPASPARLAALEARFLRAVGRGEEPLVLVECRMQPVVIWEGDALQRAVRRKVRATTPQPLCLPGVTES